MAASGGGKKSSFSLSASSPRRCSSGTPTDELLLGVWHHGGGEGGRQWEEGGEGQEPLPQCTLLSGLVCTLWAGGGRPFYGRPLNPEFSGGERVTGPVLRLRQPVSDGGGTYFARR